jgi:hypothetical protein
MRFVYGATDGEVLKIGWTRRGLTGVAKRLDEARRIAPAARLIMLTRGGYDREQTELAWMRKRGTHRQGEWFTFDQVAADRMAELDQYAAEFNGMSVADRAWFDCRWICGRWLGIDPATDPATWPPITVSSEVDGAGDRRPVP